MMVHRDEKEALRRGLEGGNFFGYSLAYYIVFGDHYPGRTDLWQEFQKTRREKGYDPEIALAEQQKLGAKITQGETSALRGAVGTPDQLREYLRRYEDAGVDQLIFVMQAGSNRHEHIMESIELFGKEILPEFKERDETARKEKAARLEPLVEAALARRESKAPAFDPSYHIPAIAKQLYRGAGGEQLLDKIAEDAAMGREPLDAAGGGSRAPEAAKEVPASAPVESVASHEPQPFLSGGWFALVEALRQEIDPPVPEKIRDITINVRITEGPSGDIDARMTAGRFLQGADETAPTTMSMPFDIAKKMFAEGDDQMAMQAMVQGNIKLEGDLSVLMRLQQAGAPTPEAEQLQERIRALTT